MNRDAKSAMIRIAAADGALRIDFESRAPGRAGYLHPSDQCIQRFASSKMREVRSLRMKLDRTQRMQLADNIRKQLASKTGEE